jgi:hypothetical protein
LVLNAAVRKTRLAHARRVFSFSSPLQRREFHSMSLSMNPPIEKLSMRTWRASILKRRAEYLGKVDAPNSTAAEAAAAREFRLNDDQRRRLMLQEER